MEELKIEHLEDDSHKLVIEYTEISKGLDISCWACIKGEWEQFQEEGAIIPLEVLPQLRDLIIKILIKNIEQRW